MNAPYAFDENASRQLDCEVEDDQVAPFVSEAVLKRRNRRLFMERFEQAFFVGLLLTLISFTVFIVLSEYSTPSALASSGPLPVPAPEDNVRVTWESEPNFDMADVPSAMEDGQDYPVIGDAVDTTWMSLEEGDDALSSSPYVQMEDAEEQIPVAAPAVTEVAIPEGGVPLEAYLGKPDVEAPERVATRPNEAPMPPARIGVLRVGGGHERDIIRLYSDPAVVYGLE